MFKRNKQTKAPALPLMHFVYRYGNTEFIVTARTAIDALVALRADTSARVAQESFLIDVRDIPETS